MSRIDPDLLNAARRLIKEGDVVWDIGTNVGLFTFAAAFRAGPKGLVLAVEPDVDNLLLLRRSITDSPRNIAQIKVIDSAVAGSAGHRNLHIAVRSRSANFLEGYGQSPAGGTAAIRRVATTTLDQIAHDFPLPDVIKLDIEGAELETLSNCEFLSRKRPIIICEVDRDVEQLTNLLHDCGYNLFDGERDFRPTSTAVWSTIAIPQGRVLGTAGRT